MDSVIDMVLPSENRWRMTNTPQGASEDKLSKAPEDLSSYSTW
jgi:hypothetical protein